MEPVEFAVAVQRAGESVVIAPQGELDLATVDELRRVFGQHEDASRVVLDLRGVSFMDSSGVTLVLEQHRRCERDGFELRLVPGPERIQALFELTGLTSRLAWGDPPDGSEPGAG